MDIIFLTNSISPHQLPFCTELAKLLDASSMVYFYTEPMSEERLKLGWSHSVDNLDLKIEHWPSKRNRDEVENCELLIADIRDVEIFNKRAKRGASTFYISERWFKPPLGILRLLHPKYFMMAHRLIRLLRSSACFFYLPQGIHAALDMTRLCGLFSGDLRCLFRAPKLDFERRPGGRIYIREQGIGNREQDKKYCLDKMRMWGYFVETSRQSSVVSHQCQSQLATNDYPLATNHYDLPLRAACERQDNSWQTPRPGRRLALRRP